MKVLDTTLDMMMRNCTSSLACDPKSDFNSKYRNFQTFLQLNVIKDAFIVHRGVR